MSEILKPCPYIRKTPPRDESETSPLNVENSTLIWKTPPIRVILLLNTSQDKDKKLIGFVFAEEPKTTSSP